MTQPPQPQGNIYSDTLLAFDRRRDELTHIERFWYFMMGQTQRFRASQIPDTPAHRLADKEYHKAFDNWMEANRELQSIEDQIRIYHDLEDALQRVNSASAPVP